ncbi:hypothetical protein AAMO2058_001141200 [Amorphochlora amoebiformis]
MVMADPSRLRVRELRALLDDHGVDSSGIVDKERLVELAREIIGRNSNQYFWISIGVAVLIVAITTYFLYYVVEKNRENRWWRETVHEIWYLNPTWVYSRTLLKVLEWMNYGIVLLVISSWVIPSRWNITNGIWPYITPFPLAVPIPLPGGGGGGRKGGARRGKGGGGGDMNINVWPMLYGYLIRYYQEKIMIKYIGTEKYREGYKPYRSRIRPSEQLRRERLSTRRRTQER